MCVFILLKGVALSHLWYTSCIFCAKAEDPLLTSEAGLRLWRVCLDYDLLLVVEFSAACLAAA
jgi:hypothetical protein